MKDRKVIKKKAEDMQEWYSGYVYQSNAYSDLCDMVQEFMLENEHAGNVACAGEISSDTVDDMALWCELRKEKLVKDFIAYWAAAYD